MTWMIRAGNIWRESATLSPGPGAAPAKRIAGFFRRISWCLGEGSRVRAAAKEWKP